MKTVRKFYVVSIREVCKNKSGPGTTSPFTPPPHKVVPFFYFLKTFLLFKKLGNLEYKYAWKITCFYDAFVLNKHIYNKKIVHYIFIEKQNSDVVPLLIFADPPTPLIGPGPTFSYFLFLHTSLNLLAVKC